MEEIPHMIERHEDHDPTAEQIEGIDARAYSGGFHRDGGGIDLGHGRAPVSAGAGGEVNHADVVSDHVVVVAGDAVLGHRGYGDAQGQPGTASPATRPAATQQKGRLSIVVEPAFAEGENWSYFLPFPPPFPGLFPPRTLLPPRTLPA